MTPNAAELRLRFLIAMGLGSMSASLLTACGTDEGPETPTSDATTAPPAPPAPIDGDGDGFAAEDDCDDTNASVHADADEVCDGIDNDCDGIVDTDAIDRTAWFTDVDGDGYGDAETETLACMAPDDRVGDGTDCAPDEPEVHPNAEEDPRDRIDNDCDTLIDEMACPEAIIPTSVEEVRRHGADEAQMFCVDRPADDEACPPAHHVDGGRLVYNVLGPSVPEQGDYQGEWIPSDAVCGPDETRSDACCYVFGVAHLSSVFTGVPSPLQGSDQIGVIFEGRDPIPGRPLTVDGIPRIASTTRTVAWANPIDLDLSALDSEQRTRLAEYWQRAGLYEHASVASFARFVLELMVLEAPPELLLAATRAQADEVKHARDCFGMASIFAGEPMGAGKMNLGDALEAETTPESVLVSTILEGCINETLAAAEAAWLADQTTQVSIARLLKTIADDESRHAALGWRTVRWILESHPELTERARETFASARPHRHARPTETTDDAWMTNYGRMPQNERTALIFDVWERVITPCAETMLNTTTNTRTDGRAEVSLART